MCWILHSCSQELTASAARPGGANPKRLSWTPLADEEAEQLALVLGAENLRAPAAAKLAALVPAASVDALEPSAVAGKDGQEQRRDQASVPSTGASGTSPGGGGDDNLATKIETGTEMERTSTVSRCFYSVEFAFSANKAPLRTIVTGKEAEFRVVKVKSASPIVLLV